MLAISGAMTLSMNRPRAGGGSPPAPSDPWSAIITSVTSGQRRIVMPFRSPTVEFYQERTGSSATTPSVTDGPVGTIRDTTTGFNLVAPSDGARGTLRASGARRWIEGDGVAVEYAGQANLDMSADTEVNVFAAVLGESSVTGAVIAALTATGGNGGWQLLRFGATTQRMRWINAVRTVTSADAAFAGAHVLRGYGNFTGPVTTLFRNGSSLVTTSNSLTGTAYGTNAFGLFREAATGTRYEGNIYGVIVTAGALTAGLISDIETQLAEDAGL
jgi:hypothetical protein